MTDKSVERFKKSARVWQTTDRQTDHVTEKWCNSKENRLR